MDCIQITDLREIINSTIYQQQNEDEMSRQILSEKNQKINSKYLPKKQQSKFSENEQNGYSTYAVTSDNYCNENLTGDCGKFNENTQKNLTNSKNNYTLNKKCSKLMAQ